MRSDRSPVSNALRPFIDYLMLTSSKLATSARLVSKLAIRRFYTLILSMSTVLAGLGIALCEHDGAYPTGRQQELPGNHATKYRRNSSAMYLYFHNPHEFNVQLATRLYDKFDPV